MGRNGVVGGTFRSNEVQSIDVDATGGDFTITFSGQTTAAVAHNASAATVQARLVALSNIGADDVICSGGALATDPVLVEFVGALAGANQPAMTTNPAGLTGGAQTATVATVQTGGLRTNGVACVNTGEEYSDWLNQARSATLIVAVKNTHDQEIVATLQGSLTKAADEILDLTGALTLADGSSTPTFDAMTIPDPWPYIRLKVKATVAPSEGEASFSVGYRELV